MQLPPLPDARHPVLERSVVACLAARLDLAIEVPVPAAGHGAPWTFWEQWLLLRGMGLVPVQEPSHFNWPGAWLAVLRSGTSGTDVAAVAYGAPPGLLWSPVDSAAEMHAVHMGFVVAPTDVTRWSPPMQEPSSTGVVEAIAVAARAQAPMRFVEHAVAVAGGGLRGDRYVEGGGTFSDTHGRGHDLTLVEAEVLEAAGLAGDDPGARRNVVTRGIRLETLMGRHFRIGEVECFGQRACQPCSHLERLMGPGTLRALANRGGLRVDLLTGGEIRLGDRIAPR